MQEQMIYGTCLVKRLLERNAFLFGSFDLMEFCVTETVKELQLQNARIQIAFEKSPLVHLKIYTACNKKLINNV